MSCPVAPNPCRRLVVMITRERDDSEDAPGDVLEKATAKGGGLDFGNDARSNLAKLLDDVRSDLRVIEFRQGA